jgi:LPXTG-site transpeptidase (sortase) family protein
MSLPVHMGGQEVIDQGVVTHYSGPVSRPPVSVGEAGTYWLAGHQSTHGKPFARLPEAAVGDQVVVTSRPGVSFTYTVTSRQIVGTKAPRTTLYGTDPSARRILLQTCLGSTRRLLVHGTLTAVS